MARIPEDELERLKQAISLQRLVEARGITLKRHGQDFIGLCPFHDDHEPSLVITPGKNLWHCLGACQTGGSVIDWVMKAEGVSFRHAVELLQADYQPLAAAVRSVKRSTVPKLANQFTVDADDAVLLNQIMDYYHEALKQNPDALAYVEKRGLTLDAIEHFKLGFANRTLGYRLPEKNRAAGAAIRGRLQRLGLLRGSGHEHFRGSLVIPVINDNQVLEVYGRKITNKVRPGTPLHLYLPGPHKGIFNLEALTSSKEIILCESLIDALTFWCAGFRNVTCSYGIEGFTDEHLEAFKRYGIERILIAYDRDQAGEKAATALADKLIKEGIDGYRIQFPKGMDANEYALSVQPASKSLGVVIRSAVWLGKGEAKTSPTTTNHDTETIATSKNKPASKNKNESLSPLVAELEETNEVLDVEKSLPATVIPAAPKVDVESQINGDEIILSLGNRRYRIRGLQKNLSVNQLKVNVLVSRKDAIHVDTFDLYAHKARAGFIKQAAIELGLNEDVIKKDIGRVLLKLEALQEENIKKELQPEIPAASLDEVEKQAALALLQSPDLLDKIVQDFDRCGVVGEQNNKLVGYLAAVSRKLDKPLAVMVQSSSAAGKSSLMDAVLAMIPEEDKVQYSAMTGQSLFYMEDGDLSHKILAIAEEEGAQQASYALKLLQSEGALSIASTGKDPETGKHVTHPYTVKGPVMIFSTTTAIDPDEELLNRCIVLGVDEGREQTRAIHEQQRLSRTLEGLIAKKEKNKIRRVHQNAQRLLKPLSVMNPYSEQLTFLDDRTRLRRDHEKYLTLIDVIALLHQYQRPIKHIEYDNASVNYIEVTLADIAVANQLAQAMLGRSLDELPPQTRRLLLMIETFVDARCNTLEMEKTDYRFSRREVREHTQWGNTQLRVHLDRLVEMEYLLVHRGKQGQGYVYELLYDGQGKQGHQFVMGLMDVETLRKNNSMNPTSRGNEGDFAGASRPVNGVKTGGLRGNENNDNDCLNNDLTENTVSSPENAVISQKNNSASDRNHTLVLMADG